MQTGRLGALHSPAVPVAGARLPQAQSSGGTPDHFQLQASTGAGHGLYGILLLAKNDNEATWGSTRTAPLLTVVGSCLATRSWLLEAMLGPLQRVFDRQDFSAAATE